MLLFLFVILIGLAIRLFLVGNPGFVADISFWKSWGLAAADHGIVWTTYNTNINYPPGFIYILWLMGKLYTLFGDPHDYSTFWRENNFGFLFASKSIAIASDVTITFLIYWFFSQKEKLKQLGAFINSKFNTKDSKAKLKIPILKTDLYKIKNYKSEATPRETISECEIPKKTSDLKKIGYFAQNNWSQDKSRATEKFVSERWRQNLPLLLSSLFFLNPIVILDSALWGQVESFGILFTLVAAILLFYRRPLAASAIFTVGTLMKLQNIIFVPIFFLFIFRYFDLKATIKSLSVTVATFFLVNLPFVLANEMKQVLYLMTVNSDYFPWLSLNAHNLWWIAAATKGMEISDKITVLGILNAKTTGLILFSAFYLLFSILIFLRPSPRNFLLSATLSVFAFFLFTTQSHERYSYPVVVLLLFFYPFLERAKDTKSEKKLANSFTVRGVLSGHLGGAPLARSINYFWLLYFLLTAAIFFNIHHGLILNYPQNGFYILTRISTPQLSILNSYFLILLFFLLFPFIFSQISFLFFVLCCLFFVFSLTFLHFSYLIKSQVSLTAVKPIIIKQDYGMLQINKAVGSFSGWKSWNRLSNNYFYYRKGFGTHANSNLVFDLDKKFKKLSTDFGVDTEAGTPATVIFKIYGDGRELFASSKMGRFDFPGHTEVDISGIKYLGLIVEDAGDGINSDHADWLNPVLFR